MHHIFLLFILHTTSLTLVNSADNATSRLLLDHTDIAILNSTTDSSNMTTFPPSFTTDAVTDSATDIASNSGTDTILSSEIDLSNSISDASLNTKTQTLSNMEADSTLNMTHSFVNTVTDTLNSTEISNDPYDIMKGKHESLKSCNMFAFKTGEYELFNNGSVHIDAYNLTLNESHYILKSDMELLLCVPFNGVPFTKHVEKEHLVPTSFLTLIGLGISMISLLVHLIVFSIVPDLRNLPGWSLAALCSSLFLGYFLIVIISSSEVSEYPDLCIASACLTHFFLLASILWMSIMSFDVLMSLLRATGSFRISSTQFKLKKFGIYSLCAFGIALFFTTSSLLADVLDIVPQPYKPEYKNLCWFSQKTPLLIFFAGPVIALICLNFLFFGLSAYTIHFNKMKNDPDNQQHNLKRRYMMYFRLSVIMGLTWITGIVAAIFEDWLWYLFVLLNTLQGFFIFLAFTCSKKVKKYFSDKLMRQRRASQQTLSSPTFQSYCFYANSIEKDLDKIVESGNEKEKTDTIVIQL